MNPRNEALAVLQRIEQFLVTWDIPNWAEISDDTGLDHPVQPSVVCFERAGVGTLTATVNPPPARVVIDPNSPGVDFLFSGRDPLARRDDRGGLVWRRPGTFQEFADFWSAIAKPAARVSWKGLGEAARLLVTYKFYDDVNDGVENAEPIFDYEYPNYRYMSRPLHAGPSPRDQPPDIIPLTSEWPAALLRDSSEPLSSPFMDGGDDFNQWADTAGPALPTTIPYPTLIRLYSSDLTAAEATFPLLYESEINTSMAHSHGEFIDQIHLEVSSRFDSIPADLRGAYAGETLAKIPTDLLAAFPELAALPEQLRRKPVSDLISELEQHPELLRQDLAGNLARLSWTLKATGSVSAAAIPEVLQGLRSGDFILRLAAAGLSSACWGDGENGEAELAHALIETMHAAPVGSDTDTAVYASCVGSLATALVHLSGYLNSDDDPGDGADTFGSYPRVAIIKALNEAFGKST